MKLLIFGQYRFLNQFPVQSLPAQGRKRRKDAGKVGGPILISLGCCGNTQTPPHFKFQLACTAECGYFNKFFPKIKHYSNLCRNPSSCSLPGHNKQEGKPVHYINHFHPSYSIKQSTSVSLT